LRSRQGEPPKLGQSTSRKRSRRSSDLEASEEDVYRLVAGDVDGLVQVGIRERLVTPLPSKSGPDPGVFVPKRKQPPLCFWFAFGVRLDLPPTPHFITSFRDLTRHWL
jgi:hypothetical protein